MKLLERVFRYSLYAISIAGGAFLLSEIQHLMDLRSELPMYDELNLTPPWSILVETSLPFIWGAPFVPIVGAIAAWRQRNNPKIEVCILIGAAISAIDLAAFIIYNLDYETEGYLFCC